MMNQEDIFKKIGQILNELNDQYQYLARDPQVLNDLELELFLANSDFLSDHVQIIKKINNKTVQKTLPEHTEIHKVVPAVVVPAPPVEEKHTGFAKPLIEEEIFKIDKEPSTFEFILSDRTPSDQFEFEEKPIGEIFDRPLSTEEEEIIARKQKLREKIDQEELEAPIVEEDEIGPEPFLVAENVTIPENEVMELEEEGEDLEEEEHQEAEEAEKIEIEEKKEAVAEPAIKPVTLNDILAGNKNLNTNIGSNRAGIKDLKQAISLNDKMLYIKDLFNGYNLAYAEAIDLLNKMPDFQTADHFLQNNYAIKHNWSAKQDTVDQFYELLNRRFPVK